MKPTKLTLKLREDSPPHLYVAHIKKLMKDDEKLHPDMKNLLKYLRKTKQNYIPLSHVQEIVLDLENYRHFERGIEPDISAWVMKGMSDEEIKDFNDDKKKYFKNILVFYDKLGYDFFNKEIVNKEFINKLVEITKPNEGKKKFRFLKLKKGGFRK